MAEKRVTAAATRDASPRLGNDPFAALGLRPTATAVVAPAAAPAAAPAPVATPPRPARTAAVAPAPAAKPPRAPRPRARRAAPTPEPATAGAPPAPATAAAPAPQAPAATWRTIEGRLNDAFAHLKTLDLPDELKRGAADEFFELLRGLLRAVSPAFYYELYNQMVLQNRSLTVDPFGLDPIFEEKAEQFADFFYRRWWRVDALGVEHIPVGGRTLLVSNHSGMLPYDGAMIKHAVRVQHPARRTVRFLVENFVFYFPFLGTLVYRYGGVRASQDNALRLLRDDQLTAVFPEGVKGLGKHYRQRYQLQRFGRGGFIKLALKARSPIVPVAVIGAEEIHPIVGHINWMARPLRVPYVPITPTFPWLGPLGLIPLPTKWQIVFGEPLTFPLEYGADEADNEILVNELTLNVRRIIHEMIYERLAQRKSVFLG